MDLGRWSFRHVGRFLGDVLDGEINLENSNAGPDTVHDAFEINESNEDLDRAFALLRPGTAPEKVLTAFAPFFEGGLSLKVEDGETHLTQLFLFGQTFTPPDSRVAALDLGLQEIETGRVLRAPLAPILKALGLGSFFRLEGAEAFAFVANRETIFILFDHRPHPWQVFAIENAYLTARDTFARLSTQRPAVVGSATRNFFR